MLSSAWSQMYVPGMSQLAVAAGETRLAARTAAVVMRRDISKGLGALRRMLDLVGMGLLGAKMRERLVRADVT